MTINRAQPPLTAIEASSLNCRYNLADGHAKLVPLVSDHQGLFQELAAASQEELERRFLAEFYAQEERPAPQDVIFCPSASLAMDTIAKHLRRSGRSRVALVEPTFDNLMLLLRAQDLAVAPVPENDERLVAAAQEYDALVLVLPNNPTGWVPSAKALRALAAEAASHDCLVVIDQTFRFYLDSLLGRLVTGSRCDWITIDDTGKTWSTLECKVALLRSSSADTLSDLEEAAQEITLNVSPLSLYLTAEAIVAERRGKRARKTVEANVRSMREFLSPAGYKDHWSRLPVALLEFPAHMGGDGGQVSGLLETYGVAALPASQFYWADQHAGGQYIRIALLRPEDQFRAAVRLMSHITRQLGGGRE